MPLDEALRTLSQIAPHALTVSDFVSTVSDTHINTGPPSYTQTGELINAAIRACSSTRRELVEPLNIVQTFYRHVTPLEGFTGCNRNQVACGLTLRLLNPVVIEQKGTDLCGIVAFTVDLIRRNPRQYALLVTQLAEQGRAQLDDWDIHPHRSICSSPPIAQVAQVDWVCLASLRDSLRTVLHSPQYATAAAPREDLIELAKRSGYAQVFSPGFLWHEPHYEHGCRIISPYGRHLTKANAMLIAATLFRNGWNIILLADISLDRGMQAVSMQTKMLEESVDATTPQEERERALNRFTAGRTQEIERLRRSAADNGHAMLVTYLIIDHQTSPPNVSLTLINRGKELTFDMLPLDVLCQHVYSFVAATHRVPDPSVDSEIDELLQGAFAAAGPVREDLRTV